MIVCTATLLFLLLIFAPFRVRVNARFLFRNFTASVKGYVYAIPFFNETFELNGKYLTCRGTVDTDVDVTQIDRQSGADVLQSVTVNRICVSVRNNILSVSPIVIAFENTLSYIASEIGCRSTHCQLYAEVLGCLGESNAQLQIEMSVSVAELSFCLLKQGVKLWMRKSAK